MSLQSCRRCEFKYKYFVNGVLAAIDGEMALSLFGEEDRAEIKQCSAVKGASLNLLLNSNLVV